MSNISNPFVPIYMMTNSGTNEEKYARIQNGKGELLPSYLDVELTNLCNFRCVFCPTGTNTMQRMKGTMPEEVVNALVENVRRFHIPGVRFIRWGEPTLHPEYISIMEKVKKAGALIHMNTNGAKLDENQIQRLIDIHLDSIKFSFQGADEGTYNEMREGGDYKRLLETVKLFHKLRGNRDYPYIQISTTLTGETAEQIENFRHDIEGYCDYYNVGYTLLNHLDVDKMNIDEVEKEKIRKLQEWETNHHELLPVCTEAFDKLSINWNGDVTLCCADYDNFMIVGNILDNDLKQIFNSKSADIYRSAISKKQYGRIKCCSICYETVPIA